MIFPAPVAQLDRATASGAVGQGFESPRAHVNIFLTFLCNSVELHNAKAEKNYF